MAHSRARRPYAALVAVLAATLALTGLGVAGAGTATARGATPTLSPSASEPILNSTVALRGAAAPKGRSVTLQKWSGGRWANVSTRKAGSGGSYSFSVKATSASTSYQVVAAKFKRVKAAASRKVTVRGVAFAAPAGKTLTFNDDFNTFDTSKWATRAPDYFHGSRRCAAPSANRVSAKGGVLTLSVRRLSSTVARNADGTSYLCDGKSGRPKYVYENAMIGTAEGNGSPFAQAYGTFAAQVKMQSARGMHGAFWLQGSGAGSAEIDVIEHFGIGHPSALTTKIHPNPPATGSQATTGNLAGKLAAQGRRATDWNVYSVDWSPTAYIFRINGRESFRTSRPYISSAQQEIVLSLLTSDWARSSLKDDKATMQVDWVRAWAY